jgi:hypothetical protein
LDVTQILNNLYSLDDSSFLNKQLDQPILKQDDSKFSVNNQELMKRLSTALSYNLKA